MRLVPGGGITTGQTVLVDYEVGVQSDVSYMSVEQDFNFRYEFARRLEGLAVYYRYHDLKPRGANLDTPSILSFDDQIVGAELAWRAATLTEEFESYHSSSSSYNQWTSRIEGYRYFENRVKWTWNAGLLMVDYKDGSGGSNGHDGNSSQTIFAGTALSGVFRNSGYWQLEARINRETGRTEETFGGLLAKIGWRVRKVKVEAGARFEERTRFDSTQDRYHVFLQVAREF